jgi:PLP dependent protein
MSVSSQLQKIKSQLPENVTLVAVSKTHPTEKILEAYHAGQRVFGENKVQELMSKSEKLPNDISWHLIGHLQTNKVKFIAPFVSLIHAVDSKKLLLEIDKQAKKHNRVIDCLLQIHIAKEETKFGFSYKECEDILVDNEITDLKNVRIIGLMGMATNTDDETQIRNEFRELNNFFIQKKFKFAALNVLSIGMSSDYPLAIENGSTMVRIGSSIFGVRN